MDTDTRPLELRLCFLRGFYDAMDAWSKPSATLTTDEQRAAWQAGQDHWHKLVTDEQSRLEATVKSGDGFPKW